MKEALKSKGCYHCPLSYINNPTEECCIDFLEMIIGEYFEKVGLDPDYCTCEDRMIVIEEALRNYTREAKIWKK